MARNIAHGFHLIYDNKHGKALSHDSPLIVIAPEFTGERIRWYEVIFPLDTCFSVTVAL